MAPSAPQWAASAARTPQNVGHGDDDDALALGLDASELQEFFGDS